jgi:hypothetical protein
MQAQRWKKLRTVGIGRMFGAGTHFRGLEKPALEAIMKIPLAASKWAFLVTRPFLS